MSGPACTFDSKLHSDQDREHPARGYKVQRAATRQYMEYGKEPRSAADSVQSPLEGDSVQSPLEGDKGIVLKATWNEQHNAAPDNCLPGAAACPVSHRRNPQQVILFA